MKRKIFSVALWLGLPILAFAALESATYINQLNENYPTGNDHYSTVDEHLRLIKGAVKNTFPNITGALTPTHTELNYVDGVTSAIQTQIDTKLAASRFPNVSGDVTPTHTELNFVDGVTSAIQTQMDTKLASASYTAADVFAKVLTLDGAASTLDADLLDGLSSATFCRQDGTNCPGNIVTTGTFTATFNGFTASVTSTASYVLMGKMACVTIPPAAGTSNTTSFTITGFPAGIRPKLLASGTGTGSAMVGPGGMIVTLDNGVRDFSTWNFFESDTTMSFAYGTASSLSSYTASGTKGLGSLRAINSCWEIP